MTVEMELARLGERVELELRAESARLDATGAPWPNSFDAFEDACAAFGRRDPAAAAMAQAQATHFCGQGALDEVIFRFVVAVREWLIGGEGWARVQMDDAWRHLPPEGGVA